MGRWYSSTKSIRPVDTLRCFSGAPKCILDGGKLALPSTDEHLKILSDVNTKKEPNSRVGVTLAMPYFRAADFLIVGRDRLESGERKIWSAIVISRRHFPRNRTPAGGRLRHGNRDSEDWICSAGRTHATGTEVEDWCVSISAADGRTCSAAMTCGKMELPSR